MVHADYDVFIILANKFITFAWNDIEHGTFYINESYSKCESKRDSWYILYFIYLNNDGCAHQIHLTCTLFLT